MKQEPQKTEEERSVLLSEQIKTNMTNQEKTQAVLEAVRLLVKK